MSAQNTEALGAKAHEEMLKKERRANNVWNKLKRNKTAMIGLVIVLFMVIIAIFAPVITSVDPDEIHPLDTFLTPGQNGHIFGTDEFGRDLFARILYGSRVSIIVAVGGTIVAGIIGILGPDRRLHGRIRGRGYHAYHGRSSGFPIRTSVYHPDDSSGAGRGQCYHSHRCG